MCSTQKGVNEDRVSRPRVNLPVCRSLCHARLFEARQTLLRKGDAVKRSSDRHQRDTEKQDEHAKNAGTEENEIDQALADSFPASDAPPWTLGVTVGSPSSGMRKAKETARLNSIAKIDCVHSVRDEPTR